MPDPQQTFQPRSEFIRTEATPQSYSIVALNGADTLRCHNISQSTLSVLRETFGNETRLYGEANGGDIAEFVFRSSPWTNKSARSETLVVQLFTTLLAHQYTFVTSIDYGRQYLDKLSLTFTRTGSPSGRLTSDSVFALSFVTPTVLRVLHAPLHCTPAILQSVRNTWPRGVKDERKLGNGSWEFRLKGFGYFSAEKSDEALVPHVFALLRTFDTHAFKLIAGVPIGGRSRSKDLWIFTAPGKPPSQTASSSHQPIPEESDKAYSPGPYTASPTVGTGSHAKFATDEPERAPPVAAIHTRSASTGTPASTPHRKPVPPPMAMPVPTINKPTPPVANPPMTMPVPSPASKPSPRSNPSPVPVPVPIPAKRNSSLLRKFRASGTGRTSSGRFKHPPPPPSVSQPSGHARSGSLASGEIIYETPLPGQQPLPNGFVAPPPPPPIPEQAPTGMYPAANRTNEDLLPRGAFRDSVISASTDTSQDVDVLWTGAAMAKGGPGEPLSLVRENEESEPRTPEMTRTMHEELRPKSEKAELALAGPPPARPIPLPGSGLPMEEQTRNEGGKTLTGRPSVNNSKSGTESSTSSPLVQPIKPPESEPTGGGFRHWFGGGRKTKSKKPKPRRRDGLAPAIRSSKRLTID